MTDQMTDRTTYLLVDGENIDATLAVSYTHLTLPTKA